MGVGLTNRDGSSFSDWEHPSFDGGKRKAIKPTNAHFADKQRRRRTVYLGEVSPKFNSQATRDVLVKFLMENPNDE